MSNDEVDKYIESGFTVKEVLAAKQAERALNTKVLKLFRPLTEFKEEEATWFIPGWMPEGQITLLAADGGIGKTTLWCNIIAAVSAGKPCVLDPPGYSRQPQLTMFITTEDSVRKKLAKKLRLAGADMSKVITPDFAADKNGELLKLTFDNYELFDVIRQVKPALCVFDPIQGFIPADINMGSRNAMRQCVAPLITLGEETGSTFLIVCHTNKRKSAYGRDRIADSADLWDISRSVIMAGYTQEQDIRYLSNEKNNYSRLQETMLFSIADSGLIVPKGTTYKRDREFQQEGAANSAPSKRDDCKGWIINTLQNSGGFLPTGELDSKAQEAGYSYMTLRRAKEALCADGQIKSEQTGNGKEKFWYTQLTDYHLPPITKAEYRATTELPF